MSSQKFLIDTNVFIGLEDNAVVAPDFSSFQQMAAKHGVTIFVHEAALDDIRRDKNLARRAVSISKIKKFPVIKKMSGVTDAVLSEKFGRIRKHNDKVDATLLHALEIGVVDFLVTEDQGIHERAEKHSPTFAARVLYVADALSYLKTSFEGTAVVFPAVIEVEANTISQADPIFTSLRADYAPFDKWWRESCVRLMRKCWVVMDGDAIAGLIVRKEESAGDTDASLPGQKILKICTFKVRSESRGIKLGELLLKQALWHAQINKHEVIYLTTFPGQSTLIALLEYYGFQYTYDRPNGERVYERSVGHGPLMPETGLSLFELARKNYPRFCVGEGVGAYVIPIREEYHEVLFPELADRRQLSLFGTSDLHRPGNTIRKVYLCQSPTNIFEPGALLFFYKGKSRAAPSQAITTVGVFEEMKLATSNNELRQLAGGRSVYSEAQLQRFAPEQNKPVKVINFLLTAHLEPPIHLPALVNSGVFASQPPQTIKRLLPEDQLRLLADSSLSFLI